MPRPIARASPSGRRCGSIWRPRPTCRAGRSAATPHAYVEAHIEQGPQLEAAGLDIGIVTGIQGSRWFLVELLGESAHAGTAPVSMRKDAVQDMVRAITALNALMADPADVLRFTVAKIEVEPNSSNSVAERVRFTIDFRHPDAAVLSARGDAIEATIRGAVQHCAVTVTERFHALPVDFHPTVTGAVERAAAAQGLGAMRMPSGAFHDAQFMVALCPSGMIFIPSRKGISHNPAEYSSPEQLAQGARVLAQALAELARTEAQPAGHSRVAPKARVVKLPSASPAAARAAASRRSGPSIASSVRPAKVPKCMPMLAARRAPMRPHRLGRVHVLGAA